MGYINSARRGEVSLLSHGQTYSLQVVPFPPVLSVTGDVCVHIIITGSTLFIITKYFENILKCLEFSFKAKSRMTSEFCPDLNWSYLIQCIHDFHTLLRWFIREMYRITSNGRNVNLSTFHHQISRVLILKSQTVEIKRCNFGIKF